MYIRLLATESLTEEQLEQLADAVKEQYGVGHVTLYYIVFNQKIYEVVTEHIATFYQRSTVPQNAFDKYDSAIMKVTR